MAFPPTDERSQKFLVGVVFLAMVTGFYYNFFWKPEQTKIDIVRVKADSLDSLNARIQFQVKAGLEGKLRADAKQYRSELDGLRKLVPTTNEVPALLESISNEARRYNIELMEVTPDAILAGDYFDMAKYRIGVTGPYHRVAEFLAAVGSLPRIATPINLILNPTTRALEHNRPTKGEQFVDAKFVVMTYVARTLPPAPPPIVVPPGAKAVGK